MPFVSAASKLISGLTALFLLDYTEKVFFLIAGFFFPIPD